MHGTNPVRKQVPSTDDGTTLWVQEVFHTLQGEGPFVGSPAVFVRLAGCNLRCWFCDTDFESSTWHPTVEELVQKINEAAGNAVLVVLTGGEPLRQNLGPLLVALYRLRYAVQIETAGTLWWDWIPYYFSKRTSTPRIYTEAPVETSTIVCSPKTPSLNTRLIPYIHYLKYIVREGELDYDGLPVVSTQVPGAPTTIARPDMMWPESPFGVHRIFLQPMDEGADIVKTQANWKAARDACLKHGYRLSIQTHKILGLP